MTLESSTSATPPETPAQVAALVDNHRAFLAFLTGRLGGDRALAEDILQDAFVRSIDKVQALRDEEALIPWFYRLLRNAVVDHQRRNGTRARALESLASEFTEVEDGGDTRASVCRCVAQLATTLKPEYADVLAEVEVRGVAVKDYAAAQGITSNNAAVRVFRAREALRKQVQRSCGSCATHGCLDCTCKADALPAGGGGQR